MRDSAQQGDAFSHPEPFDELLRSRPGEQVDAELFHRFAESAIWACEEFSAAVVKHAEAAVSAVGMFFAAAAAAGVTGWLPCASGAHGLLRVIEEREDAILVAGGARSWIAQDPVVAREAVFALQNRRSDLLLFSARNALVGGFRVAIQAGPTTFEHASDCCAATAFRAGLLLILSTGSTPVTDFSTQFVSLGEFFDVVTAWAFGIVAALSATMTDMYSVLIFSQQDAFSLTAWARRKLYSFRSHALECRK
ncbi:MAG: hypothetical protein ACTJFR_10170 [Canibacter sp.]